MNLFMKLFQTIAAWFSSRAWERLNLPASDEEITPVETSRPVLYRETETKPARLLAIQDDRLVGDGTFWKASARNSGRMTTSEPTAIVAHWTATPRGTAVNIWNAWERNAKPYYDKKLKIWVKPHVGSAHAIIEANGDWYGCVKLCEKAWHAGSKSAKRPTWTGPKTGKPLTFNDTSVGIEITNMGRVAKKKDARFRAWIEGQGVGYGKVVPDDEVFKWGRNHYQRFTVEQLETFATAVYLMADLYGIENERLGFSHVDVDPTRKEDCGPFWSEVVAPLLKSRTEPTKLAAICLKAMDKGAL